MGDQDVRQESHNNELRLFLKHLLRDVQALEHMFDEGLFEGGVRRIGAEQEMFLVDGAWRPAPVATEVLAKLDDHRFTPELCRFHG